MVAVADDEFDEFPAVRAEAVVLPWLDATVLEGVVRLARELVC